MEEEEEETDSKARSGSPSIHREPVGRRKQPRCRTRRLRPAATAAVAALTAACPVRRPQMRARAVRVRGFHPGLGALRQHTADGALPRCGRRARSRISMAAASVEMSSQRGTSWPPATAGDVFWPGRENGVVAPLRYAAAFEVTVGTTVMILVERRRILRGSLFTMLWLW